MWTKPLRFTLEKITTSAVLITASIIASGVSVAVVAMAAEAAGAGADVAMVSVTSNSEQESVTRPKAHHHELYRTHCNGYAPLGPYLQNTRQIRWHFLVLGMGERSRVKPTQPQQQTARASWTRAEQNENGVELLNAMIGLLLLLCFTRAAFGLLPAPAECSG